MQFYYSICTFTLRSDPKINIIGPKLLCRDTLEMKKPQTHWHVMFLLDSLYLGNSVGGPTQRGGCQALDSKPTCMWTTSLF